MFRERTIRRQLRELCEEAEPVVTLVEFEDQHLVSDPVKAVAVADIIRILDGDVAMADPQQLAEADLSEQEMERLATEAERGYHLDQLHPRTTRRQPYQARHAARKSPERHPEETVEDEPMVDPWPNHAVDV